MTVPYRQVLKTHKQTDRSTQPGHPSVGRHRKYQPISPHFSIAWSVHLSFVTTDYEAKVNVSNVGIKKGQGHGGVKYAQMKCKCKWKCKWTAYSLIVIRISFICICSMYMYCLFFFFFFNRAHIRGLPFVSFIRPHALRYWFYVCNFVWYELNDDDENALFGIVVVTYWRNHNSRRSSNYHLVLVYFRTKYDVLTCMMTLIRRLGGAGVKKNSLELLTLVSGRHCITAGWRPMPVTVISWSINM